MSCTDVTTENTNQAISVERVQVALRAYSQLATAYRPNSL